MKANYDRKNAIKKLKDNPEFLRAEKEIFLLKKKVAKEYEAMHDEEFREEKLKWINLQLDNALGLYSTLLTQNGNNVGSVSTYDRFLNRIDFGYTIKYLEKLASGLPLTDIEDTNDSWYEISSIAFKKKGVVRKYQCTRCASLFKDVMEDGSVAYHDNDRITTVDHITSQHSTFGLCNAIYDDMFPIKMPYNIYAEPHAMFVIHTFLSDQTKKDTEDYDTVALLYIERSDGEKIPVERYFRTPNEDETGDILGNFIEIDAKELSERIENAHTNLELSDLDYKLGDKIKVKHTKNGVNNDETI